MKRIGITIGFLLLASAAFGQQSPIISAVTNGASYISGNLPSGGIAQGSVFVLRGTNLGPTLAVLPALPLGTNQGGSSVRVTSGLQSFQAFMLFTSATQISAVMPSTVPTGAATVTVSFNGLTSTSVPIQVATSSFGTLTLNQGGTGAAVITDGNFQVITALNPAAPNQTVILWGTGLGAISPISADESQAPPQVNLNVPVQVYVGTTPAPVLFKGRAGCCVGLDQINFTIPPGQLGCNVSVAVKINSVVSNFTTMAVSNGGPCSDPNGFSSSLLQQLSTKGNANFGSVVLSRTTTNIALPPPIPSQTSMVESGSASFYSLDRNTFAVSQSAVSQPSIGGCSVSTFTGQSGSGTPVSNPFKGLDAGGFLTVTGPSGATRQLNQVATSPGLYSNTLNTPPLGPFLGPGTFTVSGPGGSNVGPFQSPISAVPVTWTNSNITSVNRSQDLTITWTGGIANSFVIISGTSIAGLGGAATGASFVCYAPGAPGTFTVPSAVLLALPVSTQTGVAGFTIPSGFLFVFGYTYNAITIPNIDSAVAAYTDGTGEPMNFQ